MRRGGVRSSVDDLPSFIFSSAIRTPRRRRDVAALAATLGPDPSLRCDLVSTGSTYTRLWTEEDWRQHASICRYARHLRSWHKSTIARAIAPLVAAATLWAAAVAVFGERYPNYRLSLPFQPMLLFGQAITLLLTMRTAPSCVESNSELVILASMACNLHAIEQMQLRGRRRVDGVGRPKFDFHTGYGAAGSIQLATQPTKRRRRLTAPPERTCSGAWRPSTRSSNSRSMLQ